MTRIPFGCSLLLITEMPPNLTFKESFLFRAALADCQPLLAGGLWIINKDSLLTFRPIERKCVQSVPDMWPIFGHVEAKVHTVVSKRQLSILKTWYETRQLTSFWGFFSPWNCQFCDILQTISYKLVRRKHFNYTHRLFCLVSIMWVVLMHQVTDSHFLVVLPSGKQIHFRRP